MVTYEQVVVEKAGGCTCLDACELGVPWACVGPIPCCGPGRWGRRKGSVGHFVLGTVGKWLLHDKVQLVVVLAQAFCDWHPWVVNGLVP